MKKVLLLGAGSVGSFITFSLVPLIKKEEIELTVSDFDTVDLHNMNNQLYTHHYQDEKKVEALKQIIIARTNVVIETLDEDPSTFGYYDIIINAVDDVEARRRIYNTAMENDCIYIETATGMENSWVRVNTPMENVHNQIADFIKGKKEEELREFTACGTRIFDTSMVLRVAGEVTGAIKKYIETEEKMSYMINIFQIGTIFTEIKEEVKVDDDIEDILAKM